MGGGAFALMRFARFLFARFLFARLLLEWACVDPSPSL
jgi:hypothetical protein